MKISQQKFTSRSAHALAATSLLLAAASTRTQAQSTTPRPSPIPDDQDASVCPGNRTEWMEAYNKLEILLESKSNCYDFTYVVSAFVYPPPQPITVPVRPDIPIPSDSNSDSDSGTSPSFDSLLDFMDFYRHECIDPCGDSNTEAPHLCTIQFDDRGLPTDLYIDYTEMIADEERGYHIDSVSFCEDEEEATDDCTTDFVKAQAAWTDPQCYDFSIQRIGFLTPGFATPIELQVRNGEIVDSGDLVDPSLRLTIPDLFQKIQNECITGCNEDRAQAHVCNVLYDEKYGFPSEVFIDLEEQIADEEEAYVISNFRVIADCGKPQVSVCPGDAAEYREAYSKLATLLETDSCYEFTYALSAFVFPPPEPITVNVRNGLTPRNKRENDFGSLLDVLGYYHRECIEPCYTDGATVPYSCTITYRDDGVPTSVFVDYAENLADDERGYLIDDVQFAPCTTTQPVAVVRHQCEAEFNNAQAQWNQHVSSSSCYDFSIRRLGFLQESYLGPFDLQVRGGAVVNGNATSVNLTVSDLFRRVEEECIQGCAEGAAQAHSCSVQYNDELGFPSSVVIDQYANVADGGESYIIERVQFLEDCNGDDEDEEEIREPSIFPAASSAQPSQLLFSGLSLVVMGTMLVI